MNNFDPIQPMLDVLIPIITGNYGKVLILLSGLIGIGFSINLLKRLIGNHDVPTKGFKKTVYIDGLSQTRNGRIYVDY